ncbi:twitching motility protein PilT [Roseateles sp. YR242]|uniref:type IV pilus twitching motility protein PilT n=1 Tax=Roseateles sp. YR242 TaxID=1855305 RepID=UPI0008CC0CA4|nr:ATPase, T2SS/T4P/T4SS family [Roseateles sp. YR242]SEK64390.1 twitching motility protein PilT [Roseateles sp. YR242]
MDASSEFVPIDQGLAEGDAAAINAASAVPARREASAPDLLQLLAAVSNGNHAVTDIHIEQDELPMIKSPRGWRPLEWGPIREEQLYPLLGAIDEDWRSRLRVGAIDRLLALPTSRMRCNVYCIKGGQRIVLSLRCLPLRPLPLDQTGLPTYVRSALLESSKGLILLTGPTGSGKTTTAASMIDHINATRSAHVVTIEEPIEYQFSRARALISQREVPTDTPSFGTGLREALRQKPDVIMVGEVRDHEAADTVLHAGESGHLVLATMHTSSAMGAISKLLSFFPPEQRDRRAAALGASLLGVVCQSLVPGESGENYVLASEMIFNNHQQATPFIEDASRFHLLGDFMRRKEDNMSRSLNDSLAQLVAARKVSSKDALRAAYLRSELHEMLSHIR